MRLILLISSLGLALAGCSGPARATDVAVSEPQAGRKLYVAKCAKCHKFYDPAKYSDSEWAKWMGKMSKKAKLKPEQEQMISRYVEDILRGPRKANGDKSTTPR